MNINTLIVIIGFVVSSSVQSVIGYIFLDQRFDRIEQKQTKQEASYLFRWRSFEMVDWATQLQEKNPHLELNLPSVAEVKSTYSNK